ncbi:MAG: ribonuclease Y [Patescibacteria group bacterium]|nr:MAG: ribonuclease Y [Patescibacteria group bacterium]
MDLITVILAVVAGAAGVLISRVLFNSQKPKQEEKPLAEVVPEKDLEGEAIVIEARSKAKEIIVEAKDEALRIRSQAEEEARKIKEASLEEARRTKEGTLELEKALAIRKTEVETKEKDIEQKVKTLRALKETLERKQEEIEGLHKKAQDELERVSSLSKEEARNLLMQSIDKELAQEKGKKIREIEEEIKHTSEKTAQEILVSAMRFGATDIVVEHTTSKVKLPDEEVKGRIIGKEGRNIRTFEELTGVDLDLDSSQGEIIISSFDPVRREVARIALEKLLADGRIQPAKIEEIVQKTQGDVEHLMFKAGDDLCHKVGAYNVPRELVQILGRFKYRFSYGQNMIEHTLEETKIGIALAHELGINVDVVRLGCLFHDIGKVVTEDEGTHIQLGVDLLRKFKIPEEVIACVAEHHEDKPFSSIESAVVNLADHISGARPGARSEDYQSYATRLKELEEAAMSFDGVEKAYAISAGREVRVFVSPEKVDDYSTAFLAREIAKKIELEQSYPGVVKVTVIRETRVSETAK